MQRAMNESARIIVRRRAEPVSRLIQKITA